jgi:hypothetical protein
MEPAAPISWPPRPPDFTPMDFFLRGFIKDHVYQAKLPTHLQELKDRVAGATATVTPGMLQRVLWQETDYCWDVCSITCGSHTEVVTGCTHWRPVVAPTLV